MSKRWLRTGERPKQGGNGIVYQVTDATGEHAGLCAQKDLKADLREGAETFPRETIERFRREASIASELDHPNIAKVIDSHIPPEPSEQDPPFAVMRWFPGGTLEPRMAEGRYRGDGSGVLTLLMPIFEAVAYLHARRRPHRDIKPPNILIDDGDRLTLSDFGLCFDVDERLTLTPEKVGSLGYRAPEYAAGRVDSEDQRPGDIFSLGKMIWALLAAERPPEGSVLRYAQHDLARRFQSPALDSVLSLMYWMTAHAPTDRPTITEVIERAGKILAPPTSESPTEQVATIARNLKAFLDADPDAQEQRLRSARDSELEAAISAELEALSAVVRDESAYAELVATLGQSSVYLHGPLRLREPHRPATVFLRALGDVPLYSTMGCGLFLMFTPPAEALDRFPLVVCGWILVQVGNQLRFVSDVVACNARTNEVFSSPDPDVRFGYTTSVEGFRARKPEWPGMVARQVQAFAKALDRFMEEARATRPVVV